jgi:hypothetical protein
MHLDRLEGDFFYEIMHRGGTLKWFRSFLQGEGKVPNVGKGNIIINLYQNSMYQNITPPH